MSSPGAAPIIEIRDLVKHFDHGRVKALDGVNLTISSGEFVAISGRSGCGKSTLLHLIAALDRPTSGTIVVNGTDLAQLPRVDRYRRNVIGLVFQLHNLLPHLTAQQNVEVAMIGAGLSRREQRERATFLLDQVGLGDRAVNRPPELSGGERQRVAIARALANQPSIILADEPTGSLDTESVDGVLALFQQLRHDLGVTILLVTHDQAVGRSADRIIKMRDGRIDAESDAAEVPA
jgi:ABC-type lipoprotein export system ATPase subunit